MSVRNLKATTAVAILSVCALTAIGARCIENATVQREAAGQPLFDSGGLLVGPGAHIYGEFYNDTDVQVTQVILSGKLLDAGGNVIAEADGPICPPDSQPHSQSVFDIWMGRPIPQHTSFQVRPIAGRTLDAPLPSPHIDIVSVEASAPYVGGVMLLLDNQSSTPYAALHACVALYDSAGNVVRAHSFALREDGAFPGYGTLDTDVPEYFFGSFAEHVALENELAEARGGMAAAVQLRVWVWVPGPEPTVNAYGIVTALGPSLYQFVMSDKVAIRTLAPQ